MALAGQGEGRRQAVLVVEHDVWPPHEPAGDADGIQAAIGIRVPPQVGISPLLPDP